MNKHCRALINKILSKGSHRSEELFENDNRYSILDLMSVVKSQYEFVVLINLRKKPGIYL